MNIQSQWKHSAPDAICCDPDLVLTLSLSSTKLVQVQIVLTNTSFNSNLQIKTYESPFLQDRNKDKNITETQSDLTFL